MRLDIKIQFLKAKFRNTMSEKVETDQDLEEEEAEVASEGASAEVSVEVPEVAVVERDAVATEEAQERVDTVRIDQPDQREEDNIKEDMTDLREDPEKTTKREKETTIDLLEDQDTKREKREEKVATDPEVVEEASVEAKEVLTEVAEAAAETLTTERIEKADTQEREDTPEKEATEETEKIERVVTDHAEASVVDSEVKEADSVEAREVLVQEVQGVDTNKEENIDDHSITT